MNAGLPPDAVGLSIAIDPASPRRLLLVARSGAGETASVGLYVSTDAGVTWAATGISFAGTSNNAQLVFQRGASSTVYAQIEGRTLKSTDSGHNWQAIRMLSGAPVLSIAPGPGERLYAAAVTVRLRPQ
jgi:photosystem II stability/assembly factor-like uncharacterized protein